MRIPGLKYFKFLNIGRLFLDGEEVTASASDINKSAHVDYPGVRRGVVTLNGINPSVVSFTEDAVAAVSGTEAEPFDVNDDVVLRVNPDGKGNETITFLTATEGTYAGIDTGFGDIEHQSDNGFLISIDEDIDAEEAHEVELTLASCDTGDNTAVEMQAKIRAIIDGDADYSGVEVAFVQDAAGPPQLGTYTITSGLKGSGSRVRLWPVPENNVLNELGLMPDDATITDGVGVGFNSEAATAAEVVEFINEEAVDFEAAVVEDENVQLLGLVPGGSLVIGPDDPSTANAILGFDENESYIGATGLGFDTNMADDEYQVFAQPIGINVAGKANIELLSINDKSETGFEIVSVTDASDFDVDLIIVGDVEEG